VIAKKQLQKKHETAIATKKQLQNRQVKKVRLQKNQFKKKLNAMTLSDCD
jgi:hypothetical protein